MFVEYHPKEKRRYAILKPLDGTEKPTSVSYARYLMSVKCRRILGRDEQVDHIDNNPENDDINNLQLLSPEENRQKHSDTLSRAYVRLKCPMCGKEFIKAKNHTHLGKSSGKSTACSRSCASQFSALHQFGKMNDDEYNKRIKENVIEELRL